MKTAIVTIAIGDTYQNLAKMTHASIAAYAKKINAKFIVIDAVKVSVTSPHFEKFQIYDLLNEYDRILYIDTDAIVREDCPNIFDIIKPDSLGIFNEGKLADRVEAINQTCAAYNENIKDWNGAYYNTGVMVVSRIHKPLFKKPEKEIWNFYEQSYLNLRILKDGIKVQELDHVFNRISVVDKATGDHRLKSYIVHYAGVLNNLDKLIPSDLQRWQNKEHESMKRNIVIGVGDNRLGDNICSEPVVRYIVENTKNSNFIIAAWHPKVFKHLESKAKICNFGSIPYQDDNAYFHINTAVDEEDSLKKYFSCDLMNMTDFVSLVCLKKILPDKDKQINLAVTPKGISEVFDVSGSVDDMVLVHPGKAWSSKTFPADYWNKIIAGISKTRKVGVIGANTTEKVGTVDVEIPDGVVDFRDLLSLEGLFAIIGMAPTLVTNDSGPLHVAGAFDNEIVLIPTCKHPDLILPWRSGSKYYKTKVLYKKLIEESVEFDPVHLNNYELDTAIGKIEDYLPDPEDVIKAIS